MKKLDINEVKNFLATQSENTKVYIGADSERFMLDGKWYADYTIAIVIHMDGCHGCKIFGETTREMDFDQRKDKPAMRLMNEVYKVSDMFQRLADVLEDRYVEVQIGRAHV